MSLHSLPSEMLMQVLQCVDTSRDLLALILASKRCYQIFVRHPKAVFSGLLNNLLPGETLRHAVAAASLSPVTIARQKPTEKDRAILARYFQDEAIPLPSDKASLVSIYRLYSAVSRHAIRYFGAALRRLYGKDSEALVGQSQPSASERARLYRAFFRYELCCRALVYACCWDPRQTVQDLFDAVFAHLTPWETEEISCVLVFVATVYDRLVDSLTDELEKAILAVPDIRIPDPAGTSAPPPPPPSESGTPGSRWVCFDDIELCRFGVFTEAGPWRAREEILGIAGRGLILLDQILRSSPKRRRYLVHSHIFPWLVSIPDILVGTRLHGPRIETPARMDDAQIRQPNLGWLALRDEPGEFYHGWSQPFQPASYQNANLRRRAWVFLDSWRMDREEVRHQLEMAQRFQVADHDDHLIYGILRDRHRTPFLKQRLAGVWIRKESLDRIIREFGGRPCDDPDREEAARVSVRNRVAPLLQMLAAEGIIPRP
ncbi:hypothetical protein VTK73DRAFT_1311 [Phialemonium thermophilum]|uniref:F-box domain-containing protein n=1 Tax=Phialemonium thermophilum TaxID=223376 RepID=A0ABR3VTN9_9PEZI